MGAGGGASLILAAADEKGREQAENERVNELVCCFHVFGG